MTARPAPGGAAGTRSSISRPVTLMARTTHKGSSPLRTARARTIGERVELLFDGLQMGVFDGGIAFTFYPGSRLIQQEAVLTTYDANVAYYYDAGWEIDAETDVTPGRNMSTRVGYFDTAGTLQQIVATGMEPERVPVKVRHRTLSVATAGGSVAVLPAPHQYFFPRDFTSESRPCLVSRPARSRLARDSTDPRYQLAILSMDERATGTATADVGVLRAVRRDAGRRADRRRALHQRGSVPPQSTDTRR